ncbi:MAG: hypothetical protein QM751_12975 [Paludibacteraceae bacterium]
MKAWQIGLLGVVGYVAYKYVPTILSLTKLQFAFAGIDVEKIEKENIILSLILEINNTGMGKVAVNSVNANILFNDSIIGKVDNKYNFTILPKSVQNVKIIFSINKDSVKDELWQSIINNNVDLKFGLTGSVTANNITIPFSVLYAVKDLINL